MSKEKEDKKQQKASPESGISTAGKYAQSDKEIREHNQPDLLQEGMEVAQTDADLTHHAKHHKAPSAPTIDIYALSHLTELDQAALSDPDFLHWVEANQSVDPDLLRAEINRRTGHDAQDLSDIFTVSAMRMFFAPIKSANPSIPPDIVEGTLAPWRDPGGTSEASSVSGDSDHEERRSSLVHFFHLDRSARREDKERKELREAVKAEKDDMVAWEVRIRERHEKRMKRRAERAAKKAAEENGKKNPEVDLHEKRPPELEAIGKTFTNSQTIRKTQSGQPDVNGVVQHMDDLRILDSHDSPTEELLPGQIVNHRKQNSKTKNERELSFPGGNNVMENRNKPEIVSTDCTVEECSSVEAERSPDPEVVEKMQRTFPEGFLTFHSPAQERLRQRLKSAHV